MLTLYSYPGLFGVADNNAFGLKVFAVLRLCNVPTLSCCHRRLTSPSRRLSRGCKSRKFLLRRIRRPLLLPVQCLAPPRPTVSWIRRSWLCCAGKDTQTLQVP